MIAVVTLAVHSRAVRDHAGGGSQVQRNGTHAFGRLFLVSCVVLLALLAEAAAAPIPWNERNLSYIADKRPVKQVIKDILSAQPFPTVITGDIRGEVTGQFNEPVERVLTGLGAAYGFVWFYNGSILYVSPSSDLRSEVVELGSLDPARVPDILAGLGLLEARFPVKVSRGGVLVTGPSRYVDLVAKALRAEALKLSDGKSAQSSARVRVAEIPRTVRVFPLTYAQAADMIREVDGRQETIPGMASLLRGLGQSGGGLQLDQPSNLRLPAADAGERERVRDIHPASDRDSVGVIRYETGLSEAIVEADVRTNSVVVRASKALLDYYGQVIERLDVSRKLVQLDVTILSVARSAVRDIGVALSAGSERPRPQQSDGRWETQSGLIFDGVIGGSSYNIALRVAALEQKGRLKVLSRPRLVGLENLQAIIGSRTTAHVRVAGAYQTDLYPVRAGLQMKVRPRVVSKPGEPVQILLALDIVDGSLQQSVQVDGIPVSNEVGISTLAVVGEGQTLLIGGHRQEHILREHSGVPGLSRAPIIGPLFRRRRNSHEETDQIFLITPRLVASVDQKGSEVQRAAGADGAAADPDRDPDFQWPERPRAPRADAADGKRQWSERPRAPRAGAAPNCFLSPNRSLDECAASRGSGKSTPTRVIERPERPRAWRTEAKP